MNNANKKDSVEMIVSATLEFCRAGGPTAQTAAELEQALASVGAVTVEQGYNGESRAVEIAENKVDALKKAVGNRYTVEPNATLRIDI